MAQAKRDVANCMEQEQPEQSAGANDQVWRHAEGEVEHSLCGMAFDAYGSGDSYEKIIFATDGETVTCPHCRAHLDYIRSHFRRYRYWLPNK